MNNILKFLLISSTRIGFSVSAMANENTEKRAVEKIKDAFLIQVKANEFEKKVDGKIQSIVKIHSRNIMPKNMMLGLSTLTHTALKKEIAYSKTVQNKKVDIVLKEDDISFHFSFNY